MGSEMQFQNFNRLTLRADVGDFLENTWLSSEESISIRQIQCNHSFWRPMIKHEIDWIEEEGDHSEQFEFKYQLSQKA